MSRFITPFVKQCYVGFGGSINMAGATMILAYPSAMLLQLKRPESEIPIDTSIETWIASLPAFSALLGSFLTAISMSRFGRRISQIASIISLIVGWIIIDFANGVTVILIGRIIQGLAMGSSVYLSPILYGEYISPKYRGALMMSSGILSSLYVLLAHTSGLYLHWRTIAIFCTVIAVINLPIAIFSPDSPSWLASEQRYEDCRRAFRWLRGDDEDEELANIIEESEISNKLKLENRKPTSRTVIRNKLEEVKAMILKKAFYKPLFVMIHVYTAGNWSGSHLMGTYIFDVIENVVGKAYKDHVLGLNINRVLVSVLAIYIISKTKRRTMFLAFSCLNVAVLLLTAIYSYAKYMDILPFDSPYIGLVLMHLHMFFVTACTLPVPYLIAGEIFPLKYKSIAGGSCIILSSLITGIYVKSFPYLLSSISIHGTYTLYACIVSYCLLIAYLYLPETKDRTLQEIENEMTGEPLKLDELKAVQTLIDRPGNSETTNSDS